MLFREKQNMIVIKTSKKEQSYRIKSLIDIIDKPVCNIYFENNNKIYGIVNISDLRNANKDNKKTIDIQYDFKYIASINYIESREYLVNGSEYEKEIPVIIDGVLMGAFIKANSFEIVKKFYEFYNLYKGYAEHEMDTNKQTIYLIGYEYCLKDEDIDYLKEYFEERNFKFDIASYKDLFVKNLDCDILLFASEYEYDNYLFISELKQREFRFANFFSLMSFASFYQEKKESYITRSFMSDFFENLKKQGINVFNVYFSNYDDILEFNERIKENYKNHNLQPSEKKICDPEEFFGDDYSKKLEKEILDKDLNVKSRYGINYICDVKSKYFNVKDGIRKTENNNPRPDNYVHLFGACLVLGLFVEDWKTIASYLQYIINYNGYNTNVVNHGIWNSNVAHLELINNTKLYEGDTVVFFNMYNPIDGIENVDVGYHYNNNQLNVIWFVNDCYHFNYIVNELYANDIYLSIKKSLDKRIDKEKRKKSIVNKYDILSQVFISSYFENIDIDSYEKIGSIVMNCNPFTLGHRHLIEKASKQVDLLIVFILSEDASIFSFDERFTMVKEGVEDIENVYVVPSSYNILSKKTFPEYFLKVLDEEIDTNIERDIKIFAEEIAQKLKIKYRFVGEEPIDKVTRKYNEIMKKVLPKYGIDLIEVKRKEKDNNIISASLVRDLLKKNKIFEANKYLPEISQRIIYSK